MKTLFWCPVSNICTSVADPKVLKAFIAYRTVHHGADLAKLTLHISMIILQVWRLLECHDDIKVPHDVKSTRARMVEEGQQKQWPKLIVWLTVNR